MARARTRTRDELFPADRGLMARMVLVSVLTPLIVVGTLGTLALVLPTKFALGLVGVGALGIVHVVRDARRRSDEALLGPGEEPELVEIVERLCLLADLPVPEIAVHAEPQANSWIVDPIGRPPRLHVTRGLLALLDAAELEAVVAHELAHVANRDATVMTVVATPVAVLMRGATSNGAGYWFPIMVGRLLSGAIAFTAGFGSTALSRYRELTADAGAVALTGRPAALASALRKVSGTVPPVPTYDLRLAAGQDALHLVATETPGGLLKLHGPTHPKVERRIAALERMEHALAHGRRVVA
ncbi:M48 family metalloprotease [Baekduia sp. Peel2402]|uniref:M48 family metalloprotease n=1 Tax=Baekduia sp. Peel2402 TaxID=3458296 RepID=UPI00403EBCE2